MFHNKTCRRSYKSFSVSERYEQSIKVALLFQPPCSYFSFVGYSFNALYLTCTKNWVWPD